jgi:fibronectin type 3 domain-containing protein
VKNLKRARDVSVLIFVNLILSILTSISLCCLHSEASSVWADDFVGESLDPSWMETGYGEVGLKSGSFLVATHYDAEDIPPSLIWHGPAARKEVPASSDFQVNLKMRAIAEGTTFGRIDLKLLDVNGKQLYAFSWRDDSGSDSKTSISLHGADDAEQLYTSGKGYIYSNFIDNYVEVVYRNDTIQLLLDGKELYSGTTEGEPMGFIELAFLKYKQWCVSQEMAFDYVSVTSTTATSPSMPRYVGIENTNLGIRLNWTEPEDDGGAPVISYNIYRGLNQSSISYLTTVGLVYEFVDDDVIGNTEYFYRVTASNTLGESEQTPTGSIVFIDVPKSPVNLGVTSGLDYAILSWSPPEDDGGSEILNYTIYRGQNYNEVEPLVEIGPVLQYNDTGTLTDSVYYYRISASNMRGEGVLSYSIRVEVGSPLTIPEPPQDVAAAGRDGEVRLTWNPPLYNGNSNITAYNIHRGNIPGEIKGLLVTVGVVNGYTDDNVVNGQSYCYSVSAHNGVGEGPASAEVHASPSPPVSPYAPSLINITGGDREVVLEWAVPSYDGGSDIINYEIWRGESSDNLTLHKVLGRVYHFTDTGLESGKEYYYRIRAVNSAGAGEWTNITIAVTTPFDNPDYGRDPADTGIWSLTSSIVTISVFAVGMIFMFLYIVKPTSQDQDAIKGLDVHDEQVSDDVSAPEKDSVSDTTEENEES